MDPSSVSCSYNVCLAMFEWTWHHLRILDIEGLAMLADRIMEVAPVAPTVNAVSSGQSPDLLSELSQLCTEVANLRKMFHPLDRRRGRSTTPRCRSTSPASSQPSPDLCWYHSYFGDSAQKCRPPCSKAGTLRPATDGDRCRWPNPY